MGTGQISMFMRMCRGESQVLQERSLGKFSVLRGGVGVGNGIYTGTRRIHFEGREGSSPGDIR